MRYVYAYKTSDGTRHEAAMDAGSREEVFVALRAKGIKAIKVVAADGSKANGEEVRGRRRFLALGALCLVLGAVVAAFVFGGRGASGGRATPREAASGVAFPLPRQEIVGDRQRLRILPEGFFRHPSDAFLARFAEPGRPFSAPEREWPGREDFAAAAKEKILISDADFTEQVDLKRIVAGLREELEAYLAGGGYLSGYIKALIARQEREIAIREKAERQLSGQLAKKPADAYAYWLRANASLQSMGIHPLPLPDALRDRPRQDLEME